MYEIPYDGTVYSLYTEPSGNIICGGLITGDFSVQNQTKGLKERKKTFTADRSEKLEKNICRLKKYRDTLTDSGWSYEEQ